MDDRADEIMREFFGGLEVEPGGGGSGVPKVPRPPEPDVADTDKWLAHQFAPYVTSDKFEPARREDLPRWNHGDQLLDAFMLGAYPRLRGGKAEDLAAAKRQYEHENAPGGLALNLLGSTASTLPLMMAGQEYAIAPAAARLGAAFPGLASTFGFLGGSGGIASHAARGALEGAEAAGLQSGANEGSFGNQLQTGAMLGGPLGAVGGALASHFSPATAQAAQGAWRQGVPLRVGQLPGASPVLRGLDSVFSRSLNPEQKGLFTEALTKQAGLPERKLTQKWVQDAKDLNGAEMQRVASAHTIDGWDPGLNAELGRLDADAHGELTSAGYEKFKKLRDSVQKDLAAGSVPGSVYQGWTQHGGILDRFAKDPDLKPFVNGATGLRRVLDDAWEQRITSSGKPEDLAAWKTARKQYKNTLSIDDALDAATGELNLNKLFRSVEGRAGGHMPKAGDIGEVATAGRFMSETEKPPGAQSGHHITPGQGLVGMAGLGLAHELGITEHLMHVLSNPEHAVPAAALAGLTGLIGKTGNSLVQNPKVAEHILLRGAGLRPPALNTNPLLPAGTQFLNGGQ